MKQWVIILTEAERKLLRRIVKGNGLWQPTPDKMEKLVNKLSLKNQMRIRTHDLHAKTIVYGISAI